MEPEKGLKMLEVLYHKARATAGRYGPKAFGWRRILPTGAWIAIAVVILVGGRLIWLQISRTAHSDEISTDFHGFYGPIKIASGRTVDCSVCLPSHFNRHQKYPLVLAVVEDALDQGPPSWAPAIANSGACVVLVQSSALSAGEIDRGNNARRWTARTDVPEADGISGLYQSFVQSGCVDSQKVFLFGDPSALPDFSEESPFERRPKILIGAEGSTEIDHVKEYQAHVLASGVMVETFSVSSEGHLGAENGAQVERAKAMMRFIF
jgi:hypothetical protein